MASTALFAGKTLYPYLPSTRETSSHTGASSSTSKMVSFPPRTVIWVVGFSGTPGSAPLVRKIDSKCRALFNLTVHFNPSLVLFHDAVGRRQSQAGAFADFLRGKKWLENPM